MRRLHAHMLCGLLAGCMLLGAAAPAAAQQPAQRSSRPDPLAAPPPKETPLVVALRTRGGMVVVSNEAPQFWTIELSGQRIETVPSDRPRFTVDGMPVQILVNRIPPDPNGGAGGGQGDTVRALIAHRDAELKAIEKDNKRSLRPRSETVTLADGSQALLWGFDMPGVRPPLFLSRVGPGYVYTLFVLLQGAQTEDAVRNWIIDAMNSVKFSDKAFDTALLRRQYPPPLVR